MPTTPALADAELIVRNYLTTVTAITDVVGTDDNGQARVYTIIPKDAPAGPFLRLYRVGGAPRLGGTVTLDAPVIQLDAYGGSKATPRALLADAVAALADIAYASHTGASVSTPSFGQARHLPDPDFDPARERYVTDLELVVRPARS